MTKQPHGPMTLGNMQDPRAQTSLRFFRYVPTTRANAWERAGWNVISLPLSLKDAGGGAADVVIVEWQRSGQPVEPNEEQTAG